MHTPNESEAQTCVVNKNGVLSTCKLTFSLLLANCYSLRLLTGHACVLQKRPGEIYVHYFDADKRMDEWIPEDFCKMVEIGYNREQASRKRKRRTTNEILLSSAREASVSKNGFSAQGGSASTSTLERKRQEGGTLHPRETLAEEELDVRQQKRLTAQRNFDMVIFDMWKIRPWLVISSSCPFQHVFI